MGLNKFGCFITVMIILFIQATLIPQALGARVRLMDVDNVAITTKSVNDVVLGYQDVQVSGSAGGYKSSDPDMSVGKRLLRLAGKQGLEHRPLVLNLLPKGTLPPSGPSKRKNSLSD